MKQMVLVKVIGVLALGLLLLLPIRAASGQGPEPPYVPGELIITLRPGVTDKDAEDLYKQHDLKEKEKLDKVPSGDGSKHRLVSVPEPAAEKRLRALKADRRVKYAERNYTLSVVPFPNDPQFSQLWGLHNTGQTGGTVDADIDAPEAWDISTGSASVIVAVIDTGVEYTHQDLAGNIWVNPGEIPGNGIDDDGNGYVDDVHGINAITNGGDPKDDNRHGTHVAGTIGAVGNNSLGVVGVNWTVRIAACKFLNAQGSGTTADAIKCFQYFNFMKKVKGQNILVTNNSWGGGGFVQALQDAMAGLDQPGMAPILHAAAAGNANNNNDAIPFFPASYDLENIVAVAATDHNDLYASFSNYGATSVDLAAPGVNILSTLLNNTYGNLSGTSMASPHVAGAAALVWSTNPALTATQVKQGLLSSADFIGNKGNNASKPTVTNGRLNAARALAVDFTPPAAVTNLATSGAKLKQVTLNWTAVGDDGLVGTASSYDIRYSTSPIAEANWAAATQVSGEPAPKPSGSPETFTVGDLNSNTTYYFAIKVKDEVGNESPLSNVPSATTAAATVVFSDNMEGGPGTWAATGLWNLDTFRSVSPTHAWYYGQPTKRDYNTGTPNAGTLTSQAMSLAGAREVLLIFYEWSQVEAMASFDRTRVQVSTDGINWATIFESHGTNNAWVKRAVDLAPYLGATVRIRFWFDTIDQFFNDFEGWYVDDVQVIIDRPANSPPVANNDAYSTNEDTALNVAAPGVLANDTDVEGSPLTAILVTGPTKGTLALNANGSFTYTPNLNVNGSDSFTYKANDGLLDSNVATVTITINPVNDPPVANNDVYSTNEDTALNVAAPGVLANDTDVEGSPLTAILVTGPTKGTLTLNANGSFTYTPNLNVNGSDSFTYKANDGLLDSNVATVTITINPVNDPPVANNDAYTMKRRTTLTVPAPGILGNDTDVDGNPLTAILVSAPSRGTLTLNPNGSFTYDSPGNFTGTVSFTYKANDGLADSNVATVTITVTR